MVREREIIRKFEEEGLEDILTKRRLDKLLTKGFKIPGESELFKISEVNWRKVKKPFIAQSESGYTLYKLSVMEITERILKVDLIARAARNAEVTIITEENFDQYFSIESTADGGCNLILKDA